MRRVAAIALHSVLVDVARMASPDVSQAALAVVLVQQDDRDESSILGNTRITAVSPEAHELGVRPMMTVAQAKAKVSDLRVRVVRASQVRRTFAALAEACIAFGATTAVSLDCRWNDEEVVWIDVTGCAHLHGPTSLEGERVLIDKIGACVCAMGHACRVAIADGPRVAAAVARFAPKSDRPLVIPRGKGAAAMRKLPTGALPIDADTAQWLESLGLRRIGDLATLPKDALGSRLGSSASDVMALIDGDDRAPLRPCTPEELPKESASLEYGIERTDQVLFVAKTLCDRLGARLEGRGEGALLLTLTLTYDRAMIDPSLDRQCRVKMSLPSPLARAADLFSIVRTRTEALGHQALVRAPIVEVSLEVNELALRARDNLHMFIPEAKAERALPRLCAELAQEIGPARVGTLAVTDSWVQQERTTLLPYGSKRPKERPRFYSKGAEPLRLTTLPHGVKVETATPVFRSEHALWWSPKARPLESFVVAWSERDRASALVRIRADASAVVGWMD
jgi:protein ImuB